MRRLVYMAALALVAMLVLAPGATAQQMDGEHMMPDGTMMDDSQMMGGNMMASPSASASATPSASDNGQMMGDNAMATPSGSATASPSASATPTAMASAPRNHHHHGGSGSSASATVGGKLPSTGGVPLVSVVSVGAVALLVGPGFAAARLLRRRT
jgi:hypothetical protein